MRKASHDWDHWFLVYGEVCKQQGEIPLTKFCEKRGLPYQSAKKAFAARRKKAEMEAEKNSRKGPAPARGKRGSKRGKNQKCDWNALKAKWLAGEYESLSDMARQNGLDCTAGNFKTQTSGWIDERSQIVAHAEVEVLNKIQGVTVAKAHACFLKQLDDAMNHLERASELGYIVGNNVQYPLDWKFFITTIGDFLKVQKEYLPWIQKLIGSRESVNILKQLKSGEISVHDAAYEFEILGIDIPKTLEIELKKGEDVSDDGENLLTDEELEEEYNAMIAEVDKQKAALPERKAEIEQLKAEVDASEAWVEEKEHP